MTTTECLLFMPQFCYGVKPISHTYLLLCLLSNDLLREVKPVRYSYIYVWGHSVMLADWTGGGQGIIQKKSVSGSYMLPFVIFEKKCSFSENGVILDLVKKRMKKWIFPKGHTFWKMFPDSEEDVRKPWDLHSVLQNGKCTMLRLILNILLLLIVLTSLFHK